MAGSLLSRAAVSERLQAANFVGKTSRDTSALYHARVSVKELEMLAARFVGSSRVKRAFGRFAGERGEAPLAPQMQASAEPSPTERLLAGVFGTSSARLVLASALQGRNMQLEEIATIVDEASDMFRFNRGLLQGAIEHMGQGISVVDRGAQAGGLEPTLHRAVLPSPVSFRWAVPSRRSSATTLDRGCAARETSRPRWRGGLPS